MKAQVFYRPEEGPTEWMEDAACRGMGNAVFFSAGRTQRDVARKVCAGCPVKQDCKDLAHRTLEPYGIWGGETSEVRFKGTRPQQERRVRCWICDSMFSTFTRSEARYCSDKCRKVSVNRAETRRRTQRAREDRCAS